MDAELLLALMTTVVAAGVCGLLSCWLVLTGWSLMGDAVSHAVLPGVVLASLLGVPFAIGALVFALLAVALIGGLRKTSRVKNDAAIGIVFTVLFALGLALMSVTGSREELDGILFGDVLGVTWGEFWQIAILGAIVVATLVFLRRPLTLYAFDRSHASVIGMPVRLLGAILLSLLAITAVVALQVAGVILVVAMLIIPGATAHLLTDRFGRMLVIAPSLAVFASLAGVLLGFWIGAEPGAMVVLVQGAVFFLVHTLGPRRGLVWRARRRRRHPAVGALR